MEESTGQHKTAEYGVLLSVFFADANTGYAVGNDGIILKNHYRAE